MNQSVDTALGMKWRFCVFSRSGRRMRPTKVMRHLIRRDECARVKRDTLVHQVIRVNPVME